MSSVALPASSVALCNACRGRGKRGLLALCASVCHSCHGTGAAPKPVVLKHIKALPIGDVDAAVILSRLPSYQDDDDIVLAAVSKFPKALDFASPRLRAQESLTKASVVAEGRLQLLRSVSKTNFKAGSNTSGASTAAPSSMGQSSMGQFESTVGLDDRRALREGLAEDWGSFSYSPPGASHPV